MAEETTFPKHKNDPDEREKHRSNFIGELFLNSEQDIRQRYNTHLNIRAYKKQRDGKPQKAPPPRMDRPFADSYSLIS